MDAPRLGAPPALSRRRSARIARWVRQRTERRGCPVPDCIDVSATPARPGMIAFVVSDMTTARCASAVTKAVKAVDRLARVQVDLTTGTVEIEPGKASARLLSDAIRQAGYSPVAA